MDNYTITFISSSNLDKEIQDSNFIKDCKIKKNQWLNRYRNYYHCIANNTNSNQYFEFVT